ncbi:hypothetical protein [Azospirillum doebereinerae]
MPTPVTGVNGPGAERATASADIIAEARQRQTDRLRAAQAETAKPADVVEAGTRSETAENDRKAAVQPYRVNLDPDTRRLYTEVLDTQTGAIIMRIPAGYTDPEAGGIGPDTAAGGAADEGEAKGGEVKA